MKLVSKAFVFRSQKAATRLITLGYALNVPHSTSCPMEFARFKRLVLRTNT